MSCQNSKCNPNPEHECCHTNNTNRFNFIIIIVLYILLAIILGSCIY